MKRFLWVVLAVIMTFTCVTCGKKTQSSVPESGDSSTDYTRKGSITIAIPMSQEEKTVLEAVASAYVDLNPLVSVTIDSGGSSGTYYDWLNNLLSNSNMAEVGADIVRNNMASHYFGSNKFVDFSQYLYENNPYSDNQAWIEEFDAMALKANGSNGEIYSLSFKSTQVSFFYNKEIFEEVGVSADDIVTWNDFIEVLDKIEKHYENGEKEVIPLAVNGSASSFWSGQMSWIFRTYVDQYFRSVAADVHTREGDWNYDELFDGDWEYKPYPSDYVGLTETEAERKAWFNDNSLTYTPNELRLLQGVLNGQYGPATDKYKNMLANLKQVFPRYCGNAFSSDKSNFFWTGNAAVTLDETSLLVQWKNKKEISEDMFDVGYFAFPAMECNPAYPEGAPDVNYTRSIGGPHGYYGVINKSSEQTALVMDFMKFWASRRGQQIEMNEMEKLGIALKGIPYIKGLVIPDSINLSSGMVLRGIADDNPAVVFARGLGDEKNSTREFQTYTQELFVSGKLNIESYATKMQEAMVKYVPDYLENRGYRSNALSGGNVTVSPF